MKLNVKVMLLGIAALCMTNCKDDVLSDGGAGGKLSGKQGESLGYLAFSIKSDKTRATDTDFDEGDENEYDLTSNTKAHLAIFFDENDAYFTHSYLSPVKEGNNHNHLDSEQLYTYVTKSPESLSDTEDNATKVLVILNGNPETLEKLTATPATKKITDFLGELTAENASDAWVLDKENMRYFTMTNSTYSEDEENCIIATEVKGKFYDTPEEALANPVTIFVERLAAKFTVGFYGDNLSASALEDGTPVIVTPKKDGTTVTPAYYVSEYNTVQATPNAVATTWRINIVNWGVNGTEKQAYLFKNLNVSETPAQWNDATLWEDWWYGFTYHRSFWAIDKNYKTGNYPLQHNKVLDDTQFAGKSYSEDYIYGDNGTAADWALNYFSYNDLSGKRTEHKYSLENTFATTEGLTGYNPLRHGTHIIVAAQLLLDGQDTDIDDSTVDENGMISGVADKYYAWGLFFAKEAYIKYAFTQLKNSYSYHSGEFNVTAVLPGGDAKCPASVDGKLYYGDSHTEITLDNVLDVFELQRAYTRGDGKQTLHTDETIYVKTGEDVYTALTQAQLVSLIYAYVEAAQVFANGRMYYAVPIQHNTTSATLSADGTYEVGDFGVVRNHWYQLNIKYIGSFGTPVDEPEEPIVPNDPVVEPYLGIEIVILPWHVVEIPDVNL